MAEIFENYSELMPEWANESLEEDRVKAVDENEGQQNKRKHKKEKVKGPENEIAKMDKLLSLVREPSDKNK